MPTSFMGTYKTNNHRIRSLYLKIIQVLKRYCLHEPFAQPTSLKAQHTLDFRFQKGRPKLNKSEWPTLVARITPNLTKHYTAQ